MPNPYFQFKRFTVYHDRCAMKVGTDGVLLGAWTDVSSSQQILDIGTGTGLIALMLAQRNVTAHITAIDIDEEAIEQAQGNIAASPWKNRIEVMKQDFCQYSANRLFDTIVSNPPYFNQSLKGPDSQRNTARHTDSLELQPHTVCIHLAKRTSSPARDFHPNGPCWHSKKQKKFVSKSNWSSNWSGTYTAKITSPLPAIFT